MNKHRRPETDARKLNVRICRERYCWIELDRGKPVKLLYRLLIDSNQQMVDWIGWFSKYANSLIQWKLGSSCVVEVFLLKVVRTQFLWPLNGWAKQISGIEQAKQKLKLFPIHHIGFMWNDKWMEHWKLTKYVKWSLNCNDSNGNSNKLMNEFI